MSCCTLECWLLSRSVAAWLLTRHAAVQNWAAAVGMAGGSGARASGVLSGMSSSLLTAAQGKALKAGTENLMGKSSAFMSGMRDKLRGASATGAHSRRASGAAPQ